jgi:hypothetical protein
MNKRFEKASLFVGTYSGAPFIRNMFTRPSGELSGICFLNLQNLGDLTVGVVECFTQNVRGALSGEEASRGE